MNWSAKTVLVTGGASFIGSHLVDHLIERGARRVRVADDLSTGKLENLATAMASGKVEFRETDLSRPESAFDATSGADVVFHLAAIHGGRGFIDRHGALCAKNVAIDHLAIDAARAASVERFVFASSACVYPASLQADSRREVRLSEDDVGPPYDPDGVYGWAKLTTEKTLAAYHSEFGLRSALCRLFTVYGERCGESHAILAMIGRAFHRMDPFDVWGDGAQVRNWTYVRDVVRGLVLAAERIEDASAVNLGSETPIRILDAARIVLELSGHKALFRLRPEMPQGPANRVACARRARERLGWSPEVPFSEGLRRTIDWYFANRAGDTAEAFERRLLER